MDKTERVDLVLRGERPDRPPLSLWYHFGVQHGEGKRFAALALDFFRHYDFDFLKVMNDYFYPMPEGLSALRTGADLKRLERLDVDRTPWREQILALEFLRGELSGEAYFIDTVFDPWNTLRRGMAGEHLNALMEREPEALKEALGVVAENLASYCRMSLKAGSAGIFLSVPASPEIVSREHFLAFVKPYSAKVLAAASEKGRMNVAHIHGDDPYFDDCLDLPARVFHWWDRGPEGPALSFAKERVAGCVMGGIDHKIVSTRTPAFLKEHVREGLGLGGKERFLLAPGCSIDTSVSPRAIRAIVEASREPL